MHIRMQQIALEEVAIWVLWPLAPEVMMKVFVALAEFAAEGEIPLAVPA